MKASMSTINYLSSQYGDGKNLLAVGVEELTRLATNRLGGLEGVEHYGTRFDGAIVASVISCVDHENSDHLHVCMIDDGGVVEGVDRDDSGHVQVVCGAPNVEAGQTVVWLPPGATVPSSHGDTEPFILSKREIRGVLSNGMLASPSELGLFDNHDGILVIHESEVGVELMKPGTEFKKLYGLDDVLLEFENKMFTHRPDCFGQIGLARELSAIQGLPYTSPEWYWKKPQFDSADAVKIVVTNDAPELVPRLMAVAMNNVQVGESPVWLKSFITRMGGKPVNNVVDISNYIMHITGQPTHAYDLNKLAGARIGARMAKDGEEITLLNGKTIKLTADDIVIVDDKKAVGVAGIMGGSETEVDENTTDILLEVASFDMYTIRKTAMRNGLFTDAFTRFSKGQSPLQNDRVIAKFMKELSEIVGATQSSDVHDFTSDNTERALDRHMVHDFVKLSTEFVNSRLGTTLSYDEIYEILKRVEMAVIPGDDGTFEVGAPYWRTDIEQPEDVVEEIGRLYGFDQLEVKLPTRTTKPAPRNELNDFKTTIRNALSSAGANEVLSYSFVHGDTLRKMGVEDVDKWCYHIRNAISPDLQYYRPSMMPSLVPKVHANLKSDMVRSDDNEFALFEIGKVHVKGHDNDEGLPHEMERLVFVFAADEKTAKRKYTGSATFMAKQYLLPFLTAPLEFAPLESNEYPITSPYEKARSATISINGQVLGVVGEFRSSVKKAFKLPDYCAGFELDLSLLKENASVPTYEPISTFPKTQQDITLSVPSITAFSDVLGLINTELLKAQTKKGYEFRLMPRDIFVEEGTDTKNLTFRIWLWHPDKTLTTEEVNSLMDLIADRAKSIMNAIRA
jgi:phenylalanyl-tRNA synthetase beta chain